MKETVNIVMCFILLCSGIAAGCAASRTNTPAESVQSSSGVKEDEKVTISEFILGAGDSIDIAVHRHDDLKQSVSINSSGMFMYPLIGDVHAAGKGIMKLRDELQEKLSKYVVNPQVTISLTGVRSKKIIVLGEVNTPGVFSIDSDISLLEAVSKAGGATVDAKLENVILVRKGKDKSEVNSINLKKIFAGDISKNVALRSGDVLYVPAAKIANVSWFMGHLSKILAPFVTVESGIVLWPQVSDVLTGKGTESQLAIPAQ